MRFTVTRVMDMIERRLTTDVTLAQAVVDLEEVVRYADLDGGRSVRLVRIGMVVDALGRYLIDAGAVLYPVAKRSLLSEAEFTSKERMVLGRWADDGVIEVIAEVADRVAEVADFTGLPVITVRGLSQYASKYPWLRQDPERVLRLRPRGGEAALIPDGEEIPSEAGPVMIGKAAVLRVSHDTMAGATGSEPESPEPDRQHDQDGASDQVAASDQGDGSVGGLPSGVATFLARGAARVSRTQIMRQRFARGEPSGVGTALLSHLWRCEEPDCPAFGEYRLIGQPVPNMARGVPSCPRHGTPLADAGQRPPAYAMAVIVDDLARLRFVVSGDAVVTVGRAPKGEHDIAVEEWLHSAAARWISEEHLRLAIRDGGLLVTDTSENGTVLWQRADQHDPGTATRLVHAEHQLGEWDSIELYTGVELAI
ncbi:MAG: FHA domain-containing protein, partial [Micromonosporaceae bacterium]|nr:FHA domain-containing protein [Micromonosporaceae bacterium]